MGWFDLKNRTLDVNTNNVTTEGAATTKAISDAFLGVAKVLDDRETANRLNKESNLRNEKQQLDLDKAYGDITQKAIDDTYLRYVDTNTGKFNQEQFDKDNVGLPMNQVSLDAKTKQKGIEDAYSISMDKIDKKAQEEISGEIAKEMTKYATKEEFDKNVNPDLIRYANGTTMLAVDKHYNDKRLQEAKLENAAAKLENAANINGLKIDLKKQELALEKEKLENKKNTPKEVNAADDSLIGKNIVMAFGGVDPVSGEIKGLDKDLAVKVSEISAKASRYYKENPNLTHNEASQLALLDYAKTTKNTPPAKDPFGWLKK